MSDYNIDHEIEEGLKRSEEMLRRQRLLWSVGVLMALAIVAGIFYALGAANSTQVLVVTATPLSGTPTLIATLTPALTLEKGSTRERPTDGMVMVYIPAGAFRMGLVSGDNDEQPIHNVTLDAFWMDEHEVTNTMYYKCVETGGCKPLKDSTYYNSKPNHPVVLVSWYQAKAYCEWAGASTSSTTMRLPTEAEWEYAARGGLAGSRYPWGNEAPNCTPGARNGAQDSKCSSGSPIEVKTFQPNGYGLYDMAGNVWEWVNDWYSSEYYQNSPASNPQGPEAGSYRVLRGGSWNDVSSALSVSERYWLTPGSALGYIGFRCISSIPQETRLND